jgi:hypothetical protein
MTAPRIGWYVHHHGRGHLSRFLAVRPHVRADVVVFSTLAAPADLPAATEWVRLAADNLPETRGDVVIDPADAAPTAHGRFHWVPQSHADHRDRLVTIADRSRGMDAFVVDVSVEVATFVRVLGLPLALFAQPGRRDDAPHRLAFDLADVIICPWPEDMHDLSVFGGARGRVHTVGGISRFGRRPAMQHEKGTGLVLGRIGDADAAHDIWRALSSRRPDISWRSGGFLPGTFIDDPWEALSRAEVVISAAGQNSVGDIAAAQRNAVFVPQARPFDEQWTTADALDRTGTATTLAEWPVPSAIDAAIDDARARTPRWDAWNTYHAAADAGALIEGLVR